MDSAEALVKAVKQVDGDRAVPVRISRDGNSLFVALRLKAHDNKE
ncbi:hypothetical protein [Salinicola tamaricis]|nr:hypothetical protein [Salinicola tamaricis]